ncbi:MAG: hypothetical protein LBK59_05550, partial [Bifidobacteriaceae bacterium]|nr:hypothetical protein [Bifidobacteriaceae bacterium]
ANIASQTGQADTCDLGAWMALTPIVSAALGAAPPEAPAETVAPVALGAGATIAAAISSLAPPRRVGVAAADPDAYPDEVRRALAAGTRLILVDAGTIGDVSLGQMDRRIADLAGAAADADASARVLVVSLCHPVLRQFGLGAIIGPARPGTALGTGDTAEWSMMTSPSTRHRGLITLADLADIAFPTPAPTHARRVTQHLAPAGVAWAAPLADDARHAQAGAAIVPWAFLATAAAMTLLSLPVVLFALTGRRRFPVAWPRSCLAVAATVPATYLASLVPWWRSGPPGGWACGLSFAVVTCTTAALLTVIALTLARRRRPLVAGREAHSPLVAVAFVAAATVAVIVVDAMSSSSLGWGAPMGPNPVHGGRFFGIPNVEFAYLTAAALTLTAAVASAMVRRGHSKEPVTGTQQGHGRGPAGTLPRAPFWWITAVVAVGVTVVDAAPQFGADLGGSLAILPSFAVFTLWGARVRLTVWRVIAAGALGVATFGAVTLVDWLRGPDQWTHAGAFGEGMMEGRGGDVIVRKALSSLAMSATALPVAIPLVILGIWTWRRIRATQDLASYRRTMPLAGACLAGLATLVVVGAVVNDSGIPGTAMGLGLAAMLLFAAAAPPRPPTAGEEAQGGTA